MLVWTRLGPMDRIYRLVARPHPRTGRRLRLRQRAALVSRVVILLDAETEIYTAPETVDDYTAFLKELGLGGNDGLAVPTNPFADSLWDLAVFSPAVSGPALF